MADGEAHEWTELQPQTFDQGHDDTAAARTVKSIVKFAVPIQIAADVAGIHGLVYLLVNAPQTRQSRVVDRRQGAFCSQGFQRYAHRTDLRQLLSRHPGYTHPPIAMRFQRMLGNQPTARFTIRRQADSEHGGHTTQGIASAGDGLPTQNSLP